MKVLALNFSAPLQSWAGKSVLKTHVDTLRQPSQRAIQGMISAAYGVPRVPHGQDYPSPISDLSIEVIPVRPGRIERDFQTVGSRADEIEYLTRVGKMISGNKKTKPLVADAQGGTSIIRRTYLGDAWFLVLVKGQDDQQTEEVLEHLKKPVYSPYLGKKAFPPTFPFLLGLLSEDGAVREAEAKILEIKELLNG